MSEAADYPTVSTLEDADGVILVRGRAIRRLTGVALRDAVRGPAGRMGWTPLLAVAVDGARLVGQVVDWVGGTGDKPAAGLYLGVGGLVSNIASAVEFMAGSAAALAAVTTATSAANTATTGANAAKVAAQAIVDAGLLIVPVTSTASSFTVTSAIYLGGSLRRNTAADSTTILPPNAPVGSNFVWRQVGAGKTTFSSTGTGSVTNANSQLKTRTMLAGGTAVVDSNSDGVSAVWIVDGDLA